MDDLFHSPRLIDKAFAKKARRTLTRRERRDLCREYKVADSAWPAVAEPSVGRPFGERIREHMRRRPLPRDIDWKINTRAAEGRNFAEDVAYWREREEWGQFCLDEAFSHDNDGMCCNCHECIEDRIGDRVDHDDDDYDDYDYEGLTL